MKNPQIPYFEIEKIIILMILVLPFVCSGQIEKVGYSMYIDYKDIIVRKGLVYSKADTILVTGRVIQYNRKKEGKRYIEVVNGKPKSNDWISFQEKLVQPQASLLGEIVTVVAVGTGIGMAVTGNDVNVPIGENFNPKLKEFYKDIGIYDEYKFSGNPNIIPKPFIVEASNERTYEEVNYTIKLKKKENNIVRKADGIWEEYYENGKLESKVNYFDGKKQGPLERYYPNGQLKDRINYKNGKEDGEMVLYDENGKILLKGFFKEGIQKGEWNYYQKGKLIKTEDYD